MAPRWLCHGAGQNTSQRSVGSRVSAPSCHRGADYGVRRVVLGVGIEPAVWESKAHALSNLANPRYGAVNGA